MFVIHAIGLLGFLLGLGKRWQQHRRQNRDDDDDDEQFNQGKTAARTAAAFGNGSPALDFILTPQAHGCCKRKKRAFSPAGTGMEFVVVPSSAKVPVAVISHEVAGSVMFVVDSTV